MSTNNPKWWNDDHTSAWERVKGALKRDWEQTKADLTKGGKDLGQTAGDTVKQAVGKEPVPPTNQPTANAASTPAKTGEEWDHVEGTYRYGVGARQQYGKDHPSWNERLEEQLSKDWGEIKSGRAWSDVKSYVRRGWDHGGK